MARKSMRLGGGGRFAKLSRKVGKRLAAYIGRKKYGAKRMAKWAAAGRRRAVRSRRRRRSRR